MNNELDTTSPQSTMPSDAQMESLLREFFRLEIPAKLDRPFRRRESPAAALVSIEFEQDRTEPVRTRSVRIIAVAMSVSAMALAVLVVISSSHPGTPLSGNAMHEKPDGIRLPNDADHPMLVSPQGDSRSSARTISPDGVTLEEADNIKLHQ